ncbi:hypothetical protein QE152_g24298 [Popillia japonica]|uniref:Uncharacterized protein n=1 Tax=Popillia japonica TaxID=7064 RepID=A0AAW1KG46_POPJA
MQALPSAQCCVPGDECKLGTVVGENCHGIAETLEDGVQETDDHLGAGAPCCLGLGPSGVDIHGHDPEAVAGSGFGEGSN